MVEDERTSRHAFSGGRAEDRRVPALLTSHPQGMRLQQLLDRPGQLPVRLQGAERSAAQRGQLCLKLQSHAALNAIELLLQCRQDFQFRSAVG